jgi:threonine aldolase
MAARRGEAKIVADFRSDNTSVASPPVLRAIARIARGRHAAYAGDELTAALSPRFSRLAGRRVLALPIASGTAANALCLAALLPEGGRVYCHQDAHVAVSEDGATSVFQPASRLVPVAGGRGRIDPWQLGKALQRHSGAGVLSLTQLTEWGTCYTPAQLRELSGLARAAGLKVHVDGARIANALVALDVSLRRLVATVEPDAMSFGATKNGGATADAVLLFGPERFSRKAVDSLRLRTGHDLSKAWYLSAQLHAYLEGDLWLANARRANRAAAALWRAIHEHVDEGEPPAGNELFVRLPEKTLAAMAEAGIGFHRWHDTGFIRLVTAWSTTRADVARLAAVLKAVAGA